MSTGGRTANPSRLERIPNLLRLEDPRFRNGVWGVLAVVVVGYLIFTTIFGDFVHPWTITKAASAVMLFLLGVLIDHVVQLRKESRVQIFEDDYKAEDRQKAIIEEAGPREAKLLEYSASTPSLRNLLKRLMDSERTRSVRLLIFHPEEIRPSSDPDARKNRQVNRILGTLESLSNARHNDRSERVLRVRCYRQPASLRGRSFDGKYVALGWYTYDRNGRTETDQIWGDENAMIVTPCDDEDGKKLGGWFDRVFDDLWDQAEPVQEAVAAYNHDINPVWLEAVSRRERTTTQREEDVGANGRTVSEATPSTTNGAD